MPKSRNAVGFAVSAKSGNGFLRSTSCSGLRCSGSSCARNRSGHRRAVRVDQLVDQVGHVLGCAARSSGTRAAAFLLDLRAQARELVGEGLDRLLDFQEVEHIFSS